MTDTMKTYNKEMATHMHTHLHTHSCKGKCREEEKWRGEEEVEFGKFPRAGKLSEWEGERKQRKQREQEQLQQANESA